MKLIIENQGKALFYKEKDTYSGVAKIAAKVMNDIKTVLGKMPTETDKQNDLGKYAIIYGTLGKSPVLDELHSRKALDSGLIAGKRECYLFTLVENPFPGVEAALVIAGSDKRGTIYGLFHLSEVIGVSPLINWADVKPAGQKQIILTEKDNVVSREPSVKFRGFFINDEWPAFGTWANKRFGGLNAKMYDNVFELLLRLKGNYLWPAMWASVFSDDGPGLENAILADEYGVVMGMSHHEPCLRHGEEYKRLCGKNSVYGDAWNFRTNREGIIKFWEDGLKRSAGFENVITVGMRGEQDSAIMGKEATMADNVELLRDVLQTQNRMIKEIANPQHQTVPKMLALYKEVEDYFYGDEKTPGLIGSSELDDVILMFSDDNFGNLRTLPTAEMRNHKGGYGIYYHFDYHGWPVSYEWVNSTYLPKVWEQMTTAYEFGVRDLWIVNVGDICTNEFPLSYFLDLAYDFDKWGTSAVNTTDLYTSQWVKKQFAACLSEKQCDRISALLKEYTRIAHMRRPESMHAGVYHAFNYNEADRMLNRIEAVIHEAEELKKEIPEENKAAFFQQVYFPAMGNMNVQKMQILAGKNLAYAQQGRIEANTLAEQVEKCLEIDAGLEKEIHEINQGKWYGMGLSEHVGFKNWNEEECTYPLLTKFKPANKARIIVSIPGTSQNSQGGAWTRKTLSLCAFLRPDKTSAVIDISCGSKEPAKYEISASPWLQLSSTSGIVKTCDRITVSLDRKSREPDNDGEIIVTSGGNKVKIVVPVALTPEIKESKVFLEAEGYIAMEAEHFHAKSDTESGAFVCLPGHGKTHSAMKAFPLASSFTPGKDSPFLEYKFFALSEGKYTVTMYMSPSNPVDNRNVIAYALQANNDSINEYNTIPTEAKVGDDQEFWAHGVLGNSRTHSGEISCRKGLNSLRVYAVSSGFVLERIVVNPANNPVASSCLGPEESYFKQ